MNAWIDDLDGFFDGEDFINVTFFIVADDNPFHAEIFSSGTNGVRYIYFFIRSDETYSWDVVDDASMIPLSTRCRRSIRERRCDGSTRRR